MSPSEYAHNTEIIGFVAEVAWLREALRRATGCSDTEITECMRAPVFKPVLNRRVGALLREKYAAEDGMARALQDVDALRTRVADLEARLTLHGLDI